MKRPILTVFIILILIFTVAYVYSGFILSNQVSLTKESIIIGDNYYLGHGMHWRGLLKPVLVDVKLRNKDGSFINQNSEQVEVTPFVDLLQHTGSLNEEDFLEYSSKGLIEYIPVNEARIKDNLTLVLRVNLKDEDYENEIEAMVLSYRILGMPKRQVLEYNGFFH